MKLLQSIKSGFDGMAAAHEAQKNRKLLYRRAIAAIAMKDATALKQIFLEVDDKAAFLSKGGSAEMLGAAIGQGHLNTFKEVYAFVDNPKLAFYHRISLGNDNYADKYVPLLHTAIQKHKVVIAEYLAQHPDMDINQRVRGHEGGQTALDYAAAVQARGEGMEKLVALLQLREAQERKAAAEKQIVQSREQIVAAQEALANAKKKPAI